MVKCRQPKTRLSTCDFDERSRPNSILERNGRCRCRPRFGRFCFCVRCSSRGDGVQVLRGGEGPAGGARALREGAGRAREAHAVRDAQGRGQARGWVGPPSLHRTVIGMAKKKTVPNSKKNLWCAAVQHGLQFFFYADWGPVWDCFCCSHTAPAMTPAL